MTTNSTARFILRTAFLVSAGHQSAKASSTSPSWRCRFSIHSFSSA